jgi:hypothetical protein
MRTVPHLNSYNLEPSPDERTALHSWHEADRSPVVEAVALYPNRADLFRNCPESEPDDVRQALAFAAASLEDSAAETNAA